MTTWPASHRGLRALSGRETARVLKLDQVDPGRRSVAQSLANLGDSVGANKAPNAAEDARARINEPDSNSWAVRVLRGQAALLRLQQPDLARRRSRRMPGRQRSHAGYSEVGAGATRDTLPGRRSPRPHLPRHGPRAARRIGRRLDRCPADPLAATERRISWSGKRLSRFGDLLIDGKYEHSPTAQDAVEESASSPHRL
jgi:hypothetical protein